MDANSYTKEKIDGMSFGGLIKTLVNNELNLRRELCSLDGRGSPYHSEQELIESTHKKYKTKINQLVNEIDYRINHLRFPDKK